jgi:AcrR family transcriptional regulator
MKCPFDSKPRWERRKDARPQELLAAALDLFVERGFAATRLEDVAKQAGVSKGTLYLYFTNKEELFKAVVRENIVSSLGAAEDLIASFDGGTGDLFRQLILNWWHSVGSTKAAGLSKLMMAEAGNFPELANFYHEEVIARSDAMFARVLTRGAWRGELRELNDLHTIRVLVAPMLMLMMWQHSFGPCGKDELVPEIYLERFIDICLNGLLKSPASLKQGD